jgi:hypothetical protein
MKRRIYGDEARGIRRCGGSKKEPVSAKNASHHLLKHGNAWSSTECNFRIGLPR